jgi:uncharacterized protein
MTFLDSETDLRTLLTTSRTIAVVGLSDNRSRDSYGVARYLQHHGYTIIPVNPTLRSVLGEKAVPDLETIDGPVDIVDIFRRPEHVPAIVEAAIRIRARAVWMQFGVLHEEAAQRASTAGLQVVTDRCIKVEHHRLVR